MWRVGNFDLCILFLVSSVILCRENQMASSFKKKSNRGRGNYPAGTKISLHNNQLLISSGVPSLDSLLGK